MTEVRTNRLSAVNSLTARGFKPCTGDCSNHYVRRTDVVEHVFICQRQGGMFELKFLREILHDPRVM